MTNAAVATGTHIGQCRACGVRYFAATAADRGYCTCRDGVACTPGPGSCGEPDCTGHPVTAIKWAAVKGKASKRECGTECEHAKVLVCSCVCAGENHGRALGPLG